MSNSKFSTHSSSVKSLLCLLTRIFYKINNKMLPDGPSSSENIMTIPTDVNLHLPIISPTVNFLNISSSNQLQIEQIFPGIYLTNINEFWTFDRLRSHGFTHIIIIDKHIQNYTASSVNEFKTNNNNDKVLDANLTQPQQQSTIPTSSFRHNTTNMSTALIKDAASSLNANNNNELEILDLNFGEESYLTTVLPNCYKAVKFIDKALQYNGAILIIDHLNNQKCLTIVTAYLMYKNNFNFNDAFQKIKKYYETAELEKFFISQLYEYEPILQVQRAQSKGHSCSRELRMAFLKRKKIHDDNLILTGGAAMGLAAATLSDNFNYYNLDNLSSVYMTASGAIGSNSHDNGDVCME